MGARWTDCHVCQDEHNQDFLTYSETVTVAVSQSSQRRSLTTRPRRREGDGTGRVPKFPVSSWQRWLLRGALALPFILLVLLLDAAGGGYLQNSTANASLVASADEILTRPVSIETVGMLYPPITTLLAIIVPRGALGLGIAGALVAGFLLQRLAEWSLRQGRSGADAALLAILVGGTPLFAFLATTNLEVFLGLTLFAVGMIDLVRFVVFANTQAGFRTGLLFAAAALTAPAFVFSILIAACVSPFLPHSRHGSRVGTALTLAFPTVAAFGSVAVLGVVFLADPYFAVDGLKVSLAPEQVERTRMFFAQPWAWLYFVPTVGGVVLAFVLRRPWAAVAPFLLTGSIVLMSLVGVLPAGSSGAAYLLLLLSIVAIAPVGLNGLRTRWILRLGALVLVVTGWTSAFLIYRPVEEWTQALLRGWPF